tara:strand:+ start:11199 stop:12470 length:1272 start_codon:yes stop_codon:yes gene_type:complete
MDPQLKRILLPRWKKYIEQIGNDYYPPTDDQLLSLATEQEIQLYNPLVTEGTTGVMDSGLTANQMGLMRDMTVSEASDRDELIPDYMLDRPSDMQLPNPQLPSNQPVPSRLGPETDFDALEQQIKNQRPDFRRRNMRDGQPNPVPEIDDPLLQITPPKHLRPKENVGDMLMAGDSTDLQMQPELPADWRKESLIQASLADPYKEMNMSYNPLDSAYPYTDPKELENLPLDMQGLAMQPPVGNSMPNLDVTNPPQDFAMGPQQLNPLKNKMEPAMVQPMDQPIVGGADYESMMANTSGPMKAGADKWYDKLSSSFTSNTDAYSDPLLLGGMAINSTDQSPIFPGTSMKGSGTGVMKGAFTGAGLGAKTGTPHGAMIGAGIGAVMGLLGNFDSKSQSYTPPPTISRGGGIPFPRNDSMQYYEGLI